MVPALLATIHEQAPADLMKYKLAHTCMSDFWWVQWIGASLMLCCLDQDKMLPYLRELTQSQLKRGLIKYVVRATKRVAYTS